MKPRILAIKLRAIGDTVIWTSALMAMRKDFPETEIHVLTYKSNEAVLLNHPAVDRVHFLPKKSFFGLAKKLYELRKYRFDWLLGFHATTSLCRLAWLAGAKKMALHHHSWKKTPRGSVAVPYPGALEDAISRDYRVLDAMYGPKRQEPTLIRLTAQEAELGEKRVRARIESVGGDATRPRIAFLPGASHHLRRYPQDLLMPLITQVQREGRFQPVVIVDEELSREWRLQSVCEVLNVPLFDKGSLRDFMILVSANQHALANDSGPGHIAVALGLKTSFVFGPGCVGDWHPYESKDYPVYRVEVDCRLEGPRDLTEFQFCTVKTCSHHKCMREIKIPTAQL